MNEKKRHMASLALLACAILGLWTAFHDIHGFGRAVAHGVAPQAKIHIVNNDPLHPKTLEQLLALNPAKLENVDIALIDLLCATGLRGSENLNVDECIKTIDSWASNVDWQTRRNFHRFSEHPEECKNSLAYYRMGMMATILVQDMRIQYNPERESEQRHGSLESRTVEQWNTAFADSRDIFLHGLLGGKHFGTCSSMPFLYVAIGRRLGYRVNMAARKYHLYARYEEDDGQHLNLEATEHQGVSTPSDDSYRNLEDSMTEEEIQECGWLRPLSNKEILGICLLKRSTCLRSMKQHDAEIEALNEAMRYIPDTPMMRRCIEKNKRLAGDLGCADRWDDLWAEIDSLTLPMEGTKSEYFQNKKAQIQFFMNQCTNMRWQVWYTKPGIKIREKGEAIDALIKKKAGAGPLAEGAASVTKSELDAILGIQ